jgi:hypothetical protein
VAGADKKPTKEYTVSKAVLLGLLKAVEVPAVVVDGNSSLVQGCAESYAFSPILAFRVQDKFATLVANIRKQIVVEKS